MLIFILFLPCVHSNLPTANFILLRLPYFESITTCCVHLIVVKSLLLSVLISSAFDTIDHQILLDRLASFYSFSGLALSLLRSYLSDRTHHVVVQSSSSPAFHITTGVPQGSVLGPLLFSLYTSPISHILENTNISFHLYADDTQLCISFSSSDSSSALASLSHALDSVYSWLTLNRLSVNPNKTEYLLIRTQQQRSKILSSLSFHGTALVPVSS